MKYVKSTEFVIELAKLGITFPDNTRKVTIVLDAAAPGLVEVELETYAVSNEPATGGIATQRFKLVHEDS